MKRLGLAILALLGGCMGLAPPPSPDAAARAVRIVSLDYCADQYLMKFARADRILAVSTEAAMDYSYLRDRARGLRQVRPRAEDVLALKPDLVVRSYGGGPGAATLFAQAGVPVLQLGYAQDLPAIRAAAIEMSAALGEPEKGQAEAARMDRRLAAIAAQATRRSALYTTPGGVTSGPGSLVDEMLRAAGYANFQTASGWQPLPLERLAYEAPDVIAAADFRSHAAARDPWSAARHPVLRRAMKGRTVVPIEGAWTACGGWFVMDAIEALAAAR